MATMQSRWIHPLFKPASTPLGHCAPLIGVSANLAILPRLSLHVGKSRGHFGAVDRPVEKVRRPSFERLTIFVAVVLFSISFTMGAIILRSKNLTLPRIADVQLPGFGSMTFEAGSTALAPRDKEGFLNQISMENRRQMASQIHYVVELMRRSKLPHEDRKRLAAAIVTESARAGYDPLLVTAVINSESTFNRHAISTAGAMGLMQIMPATGRYLSAKLGGAEWSGASKLKDPVYNLRLGIAYLKELEELFEGNLELALVAYNWGPTNVSDALKKGSRFPRSTSLYARKILFDHSRWSADYSRNMNQFRYMNVDLVS